MPPTTKTAGFCRPRPSLAKEGNAAAYPPPVFPPVASLPVARRWLARRRSMMARTNDAGQRACWHIIQPRPGIMPVALPHPTPRHCIRWYVAGVASVPEAGATDKPRCLMWLPPCTVPADAMRRSGERSCYPRNPHDQGREKLALPSGLPINHRDCRWNAILDAKH